MWRVSGAGGVVRTGPFDITRDASVSTTPNQRAVATPSGHSRLRCHPVAMDPVGARCTVVAFFGGYVVPVAAPNNEVKICLISHGALFVNLLILGGHATADFPKAGGQTRFD